MTARTFLEQWNILRLATCCAAIAVLGTAGCSGVEADDNLEFRMDMTSGGWEYGSTGGPAGSSSGDDGGDTDGPVPDVGTGGTTYCGSVKMSESCIKTLSGKINVGVTVPGVVTTGVTHEVTYTGTSTTSYTCSVCGSEDPEGAGVLCEVDHEWEFASDTPCEAKSVIKVCYKTSNGFTFSPGFALPPGSSFTVTGSSATQICLEGSGTAQKTFEEACQFGEFAEWCTEQTPITVQIAQENMDAIIAAHGVTGPADFCLDDDECPTNGLGMKWRCVHNRCLIRSEEGEACTPADEPRNNFMPWCREDQPLTCECTGWGWWRECECVSDEDEDSGESGGDDGYSEGSGGTGYEEEY